MSEEIVTTETAITPVEDTAALPAVSTKELNVESLELLNQIIAERDEDKARDLTYLFNLNQNKKTMVRMDKLSGLQDDLVDQFVKRIAMRPDEISNKELMDGLRIVQDIIERGQRQVSGVDMPQPMIQVNQQNTSINVGDTDKVSLNRESRERVKNAVLGLLSGLAQPIAVETTFTPVESEDTTDDI
jgi:hypothetical protein